MGGSPDAAAASLPYSPSPFVPSAQTASGLQQNATSTTLSLTLVVLIGAAPLRICFLHTAHLASPVAARTGAVCALTAGEEECSLMLQACIVAAGICIGGAASAMILTCCMVLCNTFRSHLGAHPAALHLKSVGSETQVYCDNHLGL